jgi:hypothetical protein
MFPLSGQQISDVLKVPVANVSQTWPALESALNKYNIYSDLVAVASLATVRVECGNKFLPIHEYGSSNYFKDQYDIEGSHPDRARRLGNLNPGDGVLFAGRGLIQLTGRSNYSEYGTLVGVDLVSNPDAALQPGIASEIFVQYFKKHQVDVAANTQNWIKVRTLVNGGTNGLSLFLSYVSSLQFAIKA